LLLPAKFQPVVVLLFPAAIVCFAVLRNPYVGIYLFFLYAFLRPYDFVPALMPLRLTMVIELVTLVSWIIYLVQTKDKIRWMRFHWFYLGFLGILGVGVIIAANRGFAFDIWQHMVIFSVVFIMATNLTNSTARIRKLIWLLLGVHFVHALRGIYNLTFKAGLATSGEVGTSFLADENDFALALNVMIPFAFFLFENARSKLRRFASGLFLVIFALGVVASFSRGGWVGLLAVTAYCIMLSRRKLVSGLSIVVMVIAIVAFAPSSYWDEIETISDPTEQTADARIKFWKAAVRIYADNPLFGVGARNAGVHLPEYMGPQSNPQTQWGRAIHGLFPEVLAETGTLGTLCYLAMAVFLFRNMWRIRRQSSDSGTGLSMGGMASAIMGSMIAYFVTSTFLSTAYYPQLWTIYVLAVSLIFVYEEAGERLPMIRDTEIDMPPIGRPSTGRG
jgi:probable O-glycosylation ligase (exosortase A-associated)